MGRQMIIILQLSRELLSHGLWPCYSFLSNQNNERNLEVGIKYQGKAILCYQFDLSSIRATYSPEADKTLAKSTVYLVGTLPHFHNPLVYRLGLHGQKFELWLFATKPSGLSYGSRLSRVDILR